MLHKKSMLLAGLGLLVLAGCSSGGGSDTGTATNGSATSTTSGTPSTDKKLTISVIPKGATHEYWKGVRAGANEAAAEYNGSVDIQWQAPPTENDMTKQIDVVESATSNGVDGIVLAPLDLHGLTTPVNDALKKKIPVVIIDSEVAGADGILSFIATDNYKGGQMAAQALAKALNDKGSVAMLRYQKGSASTDAREKGWSDEMAKHPGIKVVSDNQEAGATPETAYKASESLLNSLKKSDGSLSIDGMYTPNESSTFGTLRTLEENKWAGKIKFFGFDASDKLIEGLKKGEIDGLIVQNPHAMGYQGVKAIVEFIRKGTKPEAKVDTGATLVTKANMDSPDVAKLIAPPKE